MISKSCIFSKKKSNLLRPISINVRIHNKCFACTVRLLINFDMLSAINCYLQLIIYDTFPFIITCMSIRLHVFV